MNKTKGKFILFDPLEFGLWLDSLKISRAIELIQNHHTWSPSYSHFKGSNHFDLLKGMENAHIERGFSEIAQNLTTFPDGTVAVCRSLEKIPAGIKGANTGGVCIENVGNFDKDKDVMTDEHKKSIVTVNALLCRKFGLPPNADTMVFHHWYDLNTGERRNGAGATKSCPGSNFFSGNNVFDAENNFLPLVSSEIQTATHVGPAASADILFTGRVTAYVLNVRALPDVSSKKIKALNKGVSVKVYETHGDWCRIDAAESFWINGRYIEKK